MIVILLIFVIVAGLQWWLIKRIPSRVLRVLIQVPLLTVSVLVLLYFLGLQQVTDDRATEENVQNSIIDRALIVQGDLTISVSSTGTIAPLRQLPLAFSAGGVPVSDIRVEPGNRVTEGDIIAMLQDTDLQQSVRDAEIALALQQTAFDVLTAPPREADIVAAEAALAAAEAQRNAAFATGTTAEDREIARLQTEIALNQRWQTQLNRDSVLESEPERIVIPLDLPEELDDPVTSLVQGFNDSQAAQWEGQLRQSETVVNQSEYGVQIAQANQESVTQRGADPGAIASGNAGVLQAEIALDRLLNGPDAIQLEQAALELQLAELSLELAENNLSQLQLEAPFDGVIAEMNLTVGELPPQGISVLLIDDSGYYVDLPIDETDIATIQNEQSVIFDVDALPDANVTGRVESIAYAPLNAPGLNLVAYNVRVRLDDNAAAIRPGMTVTGRIITQERRDVLLVPNAFVRFDRATGDAFVTVRDENGRFEERLILLGERGDRVTEVRAGLVAGDEVVLLPGGDNLN